MIRDDRAMVEWLTAQMGLLIAGGILLTSAMGFYQVNTWDDQLRYEEATWRVVSAAQTLAGQETGGTLDLQLPDEGTPYTLAIGPDLVRARVDGDRMASTPAAVNLLPQVSAIHEGTWDAEHLRSGIADRWTCEEGDPGEGTATAPFCQGQWDAALEDWLPAAAQAPLEIEVRKDTELTLERLEVHVRDGDNGVRETSLIVVQAPPGGAP